MTDESFQEAASGILPADRVHFATAENGSPTVCFPRSEEELGQLVRAAADHGTVLTTESSLPNSDASAPSSIAISLAQMPDRCDHSAEDLVATLSANLTIAEANRRLGLWHQTLPADPLLPHRTTVADLVSWNLFGPRRHRTGPIRNSILEMRFVNGLGEVIRSGARVVKSVSGYDVHKLLIGSRGSLAIVTEVTFKTAPEPEHRARFRLTAASPKPLLDAAQMLRVAPLDLHSLVIVRGIASEAENSGTLFAEVAGAKRAVEEHTAALIAIASTAEAAIHPLETGHAESVWGKFRESHFIPREPGWTILKISLPSRPFAEFLSDQLHRENADGALVAYPGFGISFLHRRPDANPETLHDLFGRARRHGGSLEVLRVSGERDRLVFTDSSPLALELMASVKRAFDPHGVFPSLVAPTR